MYPDVYQNLKNIGMNVVERVESFEDADAFARMWDTIDKRKLLVPWGVTRFESQRPDS